ncbi:MAG TPA: LysM peptidoglycan-binding domain-containing protein, partial [Ilumatobacteraceae bacterium]|nr:LysM peptidoglycan-binding domain-containing protein [Ilumatobacteraceae bacterium]
MSRFGTTVLATATALTATLGLSVVDPSAAHAASRPAPQVEASSLTYTVKSGDYLFGIAISLNVSIKDLLAVNHLTVESPIYPGDRLAVPPGGTLPASTTARTATTPAASAPAANTPATNAATTYTVANGDFLIGIASRHGVTLKALLAANKMEVTAVIRPGMTLSIPPATLPFVAPKPSATAPAAQAATPSPSANPNVVSNYTVKRGDYL